MKFFSNPSVKLILGFLGIIFSGFLILLLPFMRNPEFKLSIIDILFTCTSSVCVTGLATLDFGQYFTLAGQLVVLGLIQLGGLGYMTIIVVFLALVKKKLSISDKITTQSSFGKFTMGGLSNFVKYIVKITFVIEFIGAIFLFICWVPKFGVKAIYYSIFHAISAFCSAGFSPFGNNLADFKNNGFVLLTISFLIILGGIGFLVINDVIDYKKNKKLTYHTKVVLLVTFCLLIIPTLLFLVTEFNNPSTIGNLPFIDKIISSFFTSVTSRTAGFSIFSYNNCYSFNIFMSIFLMFVGASPAGTGGGIKTSTFAILIKSFWVKFTGAKKVSIFKRQIDDKVVDKSWVLFFSGILICTFFTFLLLLIEKNAPITEILFEVSSAFGTVGLSMDLSPKLSIFSKILVMILMFTGRVGLLLIVCGFFVNYKKLEIQYPEEKIIIG